MPKIHISLHLEQIYTKLVSVIHWRSVHTNPTVFIELSHWEQPVLSLFFLFFFPLFVLAGDFYIMYFFVT